MHTFLPSVLVIVSSSRLSKITSKCISTFKETGFAFPEQVQCKSDLFPTNFTRYDTKYCEVMS